MPCGTFCVPEGTNFRLTLYQMAAKLSAISYQLSAVSIQRAQMAGRLCVFTDELTANSLGNWGAGIRVPYLTRPFGSGSSGLRGLRKSVESVAVFFEYQSFEVMR